MSLIHLRAQELQIDSYLRLPRFLMLEPPFAELSCEAWLLYAIMLDRAMLSGQNGWEDGLGRVFIYYTVDDVSLHMKCSTNKAINLLRELENAGLIVRHIRGQGKPALIYVKFPREHIAEFSELQKSEFSDSKFYGCRNLSPRTSKTQVLELEKEECNNNKINKNNKNKIYGIIDGAPKDADGLTVKNFFFRLLESRH